jgi:hypothetical protein
VARRAYHSNTGNEIPVSRRVLGTNTRSGASPRTYDSQIGIERVGRLHHPDSSGAVPSYTYNSDLGRQPSYPRFDSTLNGDATRRTYGLTPSIESSRGTYDSIPSREPLIRTYDSTPTGEASQARYGYIPSLEPFRTYDSAPSREPFQRPNNSTDATGPPTGAWNGFGAAVVVSSAIVGHALWTAARHGPQQPSEPAKFNCGPQTTCGPETRSHGTRNIDFKGVDQDKIRDVLDRECKVHQNPVNFFTFGRVFALCWPMDDTQNPRPQRTSISEKQYDLRVIKGSQGEVVFIKIQIMAVVDKKEGYCVCIPIHNCDWMSDDQRSQDQNIDQKTREAYAVIHSSRKPAPKSEPWITKRPIAVDLVEDKTLSPMSRILFSKIYTVEWNIRVKDIGRLAPKSMDDFQRYWTVELQSRADED